MTGIILTMASASVMCVAGVGVTSVFKWFHSFELDMSKKSSTEKSREHPHAERLKDVRGRINT